MLEIRDIFFFWGGGGGGGGGGEWNAGPEPTYEEKMRVPLLKECADEIHSPFTFLASGNFCQLLITFANSLDPDQDRHNVGHDLDPNCLTLMVFSKKLILKLQFKESDVSPVKTLVKKGP